MTGRGPLVIKVGGSLLDWPGLPGRLGRLLEARRPDRPVLLVGGGGAADVVRDLDRIHGLGEPAAHALALRSLDLTAHALAALIPGLRVTARPARIPPIHRRGLIPVLAPRHFLDEEDRSAADPLPHAWSVTSDSIAARLAHRLDASELLLLKSRDPGPRRTRREAAEIRLVDPAFLEASAPLGLVTSLNLRDPQATPAVLLP